jgi:hypothetical protein
VFDESLQSPKKVPVYSSPEGERIYMTPATRGLTRYITQITYRNEEQPPQANLEWPLVWWNGPEGRFDIYSRLTRLRIGSIGGDGVFVNAPALPSKHFRFFLISHNFSGGCFIANENGVYRLDLPRGPLHPVYEGAIQAASISLPRPPEGFSRPYGTIPEASQCIVFVESGGALMEMDSQGHVTRRVPLPQEAVGLPETEITFFRNGRLLIQTSEPQKPWIRRLWLLDENGNVVRHVEYDAKNIERPMAELLPRWPIVISDATLLPPLPPLTSWMMPTTLTQSILLSLLLAAGVLWHQLRAGRGGTKCAAWVFLALIFGLLGAVAYVVAHWDRRTERCPECGKRRPIAREACPHCAALWPKPAKSGFEVLEPR